MKLHFWGTRGSLPVSLTAAGVRRKLIDALSVAGPDAVGSTEAASAFVDALPFHIAAGFGGHTSCVQMISPRLPERTHVLFDLGSGLRTYSQQVMAGYKQNGPQTYHVFLSHLHWDHIMGFPFFIPAYEAGNVIHLHSCHAEVEQAIRQQQDAPSFPVPFAMLGAAIHFHIHSVDCDLEVAGLRVRAKKQHHGGDSYGWRIDDGERVVVYSTDSEHKLERTDEREAFIRFFERADAVIFDTMYSLAEAISIKADWGHSSNIVGVELCQAAQAKRLVMFHHEPAFDDAQLWRVFEETRRFEEITRDVAPLEVLAAYDGLTLNL
jgi:phosphoribosyl 1,2-cyclic phosphodiesterase